MAMAIVIKQYRAQLPQRRVKEAKKYLLFYCLMDPSSYIFTNNNQDASFFQGQRASTNISIGGGRAEEACAPIPKFGHSCFSEEGGFFPGKSKSLWLLGLNFPLCLQVQTQVTNMSCCHRPTSGSAKRLELQSEDHNSNDL